MDRRASLGYLQQSAVNSRAGAASRQSLGPGAFRVSNANGDSGLPPKSRRSSLLEEQPRRPSIHAGARRASICENGGNRKSSIGTGGQQLQRKRADPRNINEKQYMSTSIRNLVQFLTSHNFDHILSPQTLKAPSTRDFNNIVLFLFRQLDPNFTCDGKIDEEIITMFKNLRYPYTISKSNLVSVGAPTAWPSLLACLMWLIELINYNEAKEQGISTEGEFDDASASEKAFYAYLCKTYTCFLGGDDEGYAMLEEQFVEMFESSNRTVKEQTERLENAIAVLVSEIQLIESRRSYLPELQEKKKDYLKDQGKLEKFIDEMVKKKENLREKIDSRRQELQRIESTISATEVDVEELKERIASQELSPEDVKRIVEKREKLEEALSAATKNKEEGTAKAWELETELRDKVQVLDDSARRYNQIAEDLKLLPHTARNARGRNFGVLTNYYVYS